ncbi:MAG: protein-glutamate O-methyltransferase CheR [Gemmatimonadales bacterium]|nr:protein-glutamate O-methyltransferase CheR [Gemmatimonadales bacterium]
MSAAPMLDPAGYERLTRHLYDHVGLAFDDRRRDFLLKRVARRAEAVGLASADRYVDFLTRADAEGRELQALVDLVTTNETYLFREYEQLEAFAHVCLPELCARRAADGPRTLRIWSAGCSTGDEAYTLAIILLEVLPPAEGWQVEVFASDIDRQVLARAEAGVYGERAVRDVPAPYLSAHFDAVPEGWRVRPHVRRRVRFAHLNLHDRLAMRAQRDFDAVFCRNVLIYFDDASRRGVVDRLYTALRPGGYLFLGHSESVSRVTSAFRLVRAEGHLLHQKP